MSIEVLTSGISKPGASIFVKGLSETDTVIATNGSKTLTGRWTQIPNPAFHGLPDGYTELEYIESTGTQYIDTGVQNNGLIDFSVTFEQTGWENQSDKQAIVLGSNDSWSASATDHMNMLWITGNSGNNFASGIYLAYNSYKFTRIREVGITEKISVKKKNGSLFIDDSEVSSYTETSFSIVPTVHLFCGYQQNISSTIYKFIGKVYDCKIWDENNNLVLDFIPCKNSSGEVGMYDLVTNTFFSNAGTGTFVAGAEVPQTIGSFLIKPIRDFGTWTVTATNGVHTKMQNVLVDVITEYEIEMDYKLWLYKDGSECEDVTGGWSSSEYTSVSTLQEPTKNNNSITLYCNTNNYASFIGTVNPVSFKGYSKLKCCTKNVSISGTYAGGTIHFDAQKTGASAPNQYVSFVRSSEESECELDISRYQDTYYICASAFNATSKADLTKVWLE